MTEPNDNAPAGRNVGGRFTAGNKFSRGRRGNRAKLGEKFLDALLAEWRKSGKRALERASNDDPVAFAKIVANLLPKELMQTLNVNQNQTISVELATWGSAYDAWGRFVDARPPANLIEAKSDGEPEPVNSDGSDAAD